MQPNKLIKLCSFIVLSLSLLFVVPMTTNAQDAPITTTTTTTVPVTTTTTTQKHKVDGPTAEQIRKWVEAYRRHQIRMWVAAYRRHQIRMWIATVNWNKWMAAAVKYEKAKKAYPSGLCGGDLPPCYVMMRESRGNITAQNPRSTASGKWQFLDSTWAGFGGYAKARYAPESVQDAKARQLWNHGRGCSHWNACG
jgi:hypothetical protein